MLARWISFVLFTALAVPATATGILVPDLPKRSVRPPVRPPIRPPMPPPRAPLQLQTLDISVVIENGSAVTEIDQVFYNPGGRIEQATYLFPMPENAHTEAFTLWINGKETAGELLDAKKARKIYDDIVRRMRDPALLEYAGSSLFRINVFPIEARSTRRLKLRYREVIERDGALNRYRFPLRAGRIAGEIGNLNLNVEIKSNEPLKALTALTHDLEIIRKGNREAQLTLEAEKTLPERNLDILWSTDRAPIGLDILAHADGKERFFWLSIAPDLVKQKPVPKDLMLIIDTSGSMAGKKMEQAREALLFCIDQLKPDDRFAIVRFSTEAEVFQTDWRIANSENRRAARAFIKEFQALGGTNLDDAMNRALAFTAAVDRPQMSVLITDGKPTIGETNEDRLIARFTEGDKTHMRIFPFGVGYNLNVHLLDRLAEKSGGWRTYAGPDEDLELKLSSLYQRLHAPILIDPEIEIDGVRIQQTYPAKLPDLFAGIPLQLFGRYRGNGQSKVTLSGQINGRRETFTYRVRFPDRETDFGYIAELWARRRVGYLLDRIRLDGESKELVDEVIHLAREYALITPYTSYLILEDDAVAQRPMSAPLRMAAEESLNQFVDVRPVQPKEKSGKASVDASKDFQKYGLASNIAASDVDMELKKRERKQLWQNAIGKAFYLVRGFWNEAGLDPDEKADEVVAFASDAYFALADKHPKLRQVFAQGNQVRFRHDDKIYEVREQTNP